jgi:2',3'-cyclic-nucleotide 2'-phosphodiesterase (5'-nucleotidase family)
MNPLLNRFIGVVLGGLLFGAPAHAATVDVTFLLVNDVDQMSERGGRGGYTRVAAVVAAERKTRPNLLFVHAGDAISPSLLSGFDQGAHIVTLLNMIRPDVFVPGNHEFDFGPDIFRKRMAEAQFPVLAANLRDGEGRPLPDIEDTRVVEFGGVKIGLVGLASEDTAIKSTPGNLRIEPALAKGLEQAAELRKAGAQIIVAVAHADRTGDRELVDSRAFDVILSGDDHALTVHFDGRTVLMESFSQGDYVSALDLKIETSEREGETSVEWWPSFRIIDTATVEPDPALLTRTEAFEAELSRELDLVIGTTATELDSRRATVRTSEAAIGNLIADAMREAVGAQLGLMNSGGIRADRTYPPGAEITRKDILAEMPFGNRVVKLEVTGEIVRQALENGFSRIDDGSGRFPQISGMVVEADPKAPLGSRVKSVTIGGAPLDPAATYTLAVNDFNARGGDDYGMLADAPRVLGERDGPLLASVVMAHIRKRGEIAPTVEGRIIQVD